jgi:hypothetical protein
VWSAQQAPMALNLGFLDLYTTYIIYKNPARNSQEAHAISITVIN